MITLGIIGVVTALTMPSLIAQHKEKQTIAKLKKIYSTFSNAYMLTLNEHGTPDSWADIYNTNADGVLAFWNRLKPNLKIAKECDFEKRFNCWTPDNYFIQLNGTETINHIHNGYTKTAILNDGTMVALVLHRTNTIPNPGCVYNDNYFSCADLIVKTDNSKKQIYGKNIFVFRFEHNIFVPDGKNKNMERCYSYGDTCTAWAVFNGNMEYTRCNDLSWNGKSKCK